MRKRLAILLISVPLLAEDRTADIQFCVFSGRKRPEAVVTDSGQLAALQSALAFRLSSPVPCSEVPPQPSTPAYTGLLLAFTPAFPAPSAWFMVRNGYVHSETGQPCYRDSGQGLERLAAETAFRLEDVSAPASARPMDYLACMVPNELHPDAAPCPTSSRIRNAARRASPPGDGGTDAAGRRVSAGTPSRFPGRVPGSPVFTYPAPSGSK
jgi:hypothetical protein